MPINEVWQINHEGTLMGERVMNVYHYRLESGTGSALDLSQAFTDEIQPLLLPWTANNMVWDTIRVINLGDLTDFAIGTVSAAGASVSNMLPAECAVNLTLRLDTRAVRPGSKRYSAIPVDATTDGLVSDASTITDINALAVALASPIAYDTEPQAVYHPIVVKRVAYVNSNGNDSYRLPATTLELVFGNVTGVLVNLDISHQDTRDNGR